MLLTSGLEKRLTKLSSMRKEIVLENWHRKDHFDFFSQFDEPFFGITTKVDCTRAYQKAQETKQSIFLYYLHKSLVAANQTDPFRYRITGGKIFEYDVAHASPTINRSDGSFGFSYMEYREDFDSFASLARIEIEKVRNDKGLNPAVIGENVIHFSTIPWIDFT